MKFPLNEPAIARKKSQIDEYLEFYGGPGAQHLALATNDILAHGRRACAPTAWSSSTTPDSYYEDPELRARIGEVRVPVEELQGARASSSTATRTATCCRSSPSPCGDRPTVFFEIIERHGSLGFGKGNFKALFEAIEREQDRRGNL